MSNLPISSKYRSRPNEPVTDEERNQLSTMANDAYADGKLTTEEYQAHVDTIFDAQTLGELVPVVETLGKAPTYNQPALVGQDGQNAPGHLPDIKAPSGRMGLAVLGVGGGAVLLLLLLLLVLVL